MAADRFVCDQCNERGLTLLAEGAVCELCGAEYDEDRREDWDDG